MSDEKSFQYVKIMLPLFRAVVKFCSINKLFTNDFAHVIVLVQKYVHMPHISSKETEKRIVRYDKANINQTNLFKQGNYRS